MGEPAPSTSQAGQTVNPYCLVRRPWQLLDQGHYAAGAVLGTRWLTEDLCEGTLIHIVTDCVAVTNFVNHCHLAVTAGHSYLAKAP